MPLHRDFRRNTMRDQRLKKEKLKRSQELRHRMPKSIESKEKKPIIIVLYER